MVVYINIMEHSYMRRNNLVLVNMKYCRDSEGGRQLLQRAEKFLKLSMPHIRLINVTRMSCVSNDYLMTKRQRL